MIDAGVFVPDDRVELIQGEILVISPEKSRHAAAIDLVAEALRKAFGTTGHTVRIQHPIALEPDSEPEPDLAVVGGSPRDYVDAHPTTALLVVEVADTSLSFDRTTKRALYARAGIEYWIVNLVDSCVEAHRRPSDGAYRSVTSHVAPEKLTPTTLPDAMIPVADLLV